MGSDPSALSESTKAAASWKEVRLRIIRSALCESKRSGNSCTLCAIVVQFDAALRSIGEWVTGIMDVIQRVVLEP